MTIKLRVPDKATTDDLLDLIYSTRLADRPNIVWQATVVVISRLRTLRDGRGQLVMQGYPWSTREPMLLFGLPVEEVAD